jgi:DNA-binding FadR family transcriptional regulator
MGELSDAIVGTIYPEGTTLPSVTALHHQFGCSKGVAREAVRGLEERGLVKVLPGRGAKVQQREAWDTRNPHVLRACVDRGPDPDTLRLTIQARSSVECVAADLAIESASDDDFRLLANLIETMESAGAALEFVSAEEWFHRTLMLLSGNEQLAKLTEPWHALLAEIRRERAPDRDRSAIRHHRLILEGVSSRDGALASESILAYGDRLTDWVSACP